MQIAIWQSLDTRTAVHADVRDVTHCTSSHSGKIEVSRPARPCRPEAGRSSSYRLLSIWSVGRYLMQLARSAALHDSQSLDPVSQSERDRG